MIIFFINKIFATVFDFQEFHYRKKFVTAVTNLCGAFLDFFPFFFVAVDFFKGN